MLRFAHPNFEFQQRQGNTCLCVQNGLKTVADS